MVVFTARCRGLTHRCVSLCVSCRKANEGLLTLSQEETMPISIRQLAYGTVSLHWTSFFFYLQHQLVSTRLLEQSITTALRASELNSDQKHLCLK